MKSWPLHAGVVGEHHGRPVRRLERDLEVGHPACGDLLELDVEVLDDAGAADRQRDDVHAALLVGDRHRRGGLRVARARTRAGDDDRVAPPPIAPGASASSSSETTGVEPQALLCARRQLVGRRTEALPGASSPKERSATGDVMPGVAVASVRGHRLRRPRARVLVIVASTLNLLPRLDRRRRRPRRDLGLRRRQRRACPSASRRSRRRARSPGRSCRRRGRRRLRRSSRARARRARRAGRPARSRSRRCCAGPGAPPGARRRRIVVAAVERARAADLEVEVVDVWRRRPAARARRSRRASRAPGRASLVTSNVRVNVWPLCANTTGSSSNQRPVVAAPCEPRHAEALVDAGRDAGAAAGDRRRAADQHRLDHRRRRPSPVMRGRPSAPPRRAR